MKSWFLAMMVSWQCLSSFGQLQWLSDDQTALQVAKPDNKFVLIYFSGSDWCDVCKRLQSELLDQPEFISFAQAQLVLVQVDFPRYHPMADLQLQGNRYLRQKYHVSGYPTMVVLAPDGQEYLRLDYMPGGPPAYLNRLGIIPTIRDAMQKSHAPPPPPSEPDPPRRKPVPFVYYVPSPPVHYGPLALKSISGTKQKRFALINNATMMAGDTADVHVGDKDVVVCCKEIRSDSVLITADGKPMELKLPVK